MNENDEFIRIAVKRRQLVSLIDALRESHEFAQRVLADEESNPNFDYSDYDEGMADWREVIAHYAEALLDNMITEV